MSDTNNVFYEKGEGRNEDLRQIWEEEHLKHVPEVYRQFAVEFHEGKELEDDYKK